MSFVCFLNWFSQILTEFEAEAEKEGKQRVGEGVKNFIEKVRIFAEKLGWDESKIKRTVLLGVSDER